MSYKFLQFTAFSMKGCLFLLVSSLLFAINTNASSIKQLDVNELIEQSEFVFQGRVVASDARWNASKSLIKTHITFEVDEVIAGNYQQSTLELSFVGGTIGNDNVEAKGLRQPVVGEKGIYFVHSLTRELLIHVNRLLVSTKERKKERTTLHNLTF